MPASALVVGLFIAAALARGRFDRPAPIRGDTTAAWYYFALVIYVSAFVIPYAVVVAFSARVPTWLLPVLLAIALTTIVPTVPPASRADAWLRRRLHGMSGAPSVARQLAHELYAADFRPGDRVGSDVTALLKRRGYDPGESWLPPAEPMRALWLKAALLFHQVRGWDEDLAYREFVRGTAHEFDRLRGRFDHLSLKVVRVLGTVDRLGGLSCDLAQASGLSGRPGAAWRGTAKADHAVKLTVDDLLADITDDVASFLRELCLYAARGVLAGSLTAGGRLRRLQGLGFALDRPLPSIPSLLGWAFVAYFTLFVGFMVAPLLHQGPGAPIGDWMVRIIMIVTSQVIALAIAILSKESLGFANEDFRGHPPVRFIVAAGLAAVLAAGVLQLLVRWITPGNDLAAAVAGLRRAAPWLLTAFATASATAFLVQDSRWSSVRSGLRRRLLDAGFMAAAIMVAVQAAVWLGAPTALPLPRRLVLSGLVGLVIGGTVPGARRHPLPLSSGARRVCPSRPPAVPMRPAGGDEEPAPPLTTMAQRAGERVSPG